MSRLKFDFKAEMKEKYADFQELRQKEEDNEDEIEDSILYESKCATMEILESMHHNLLNSIDSEERKENKVVIDTMLAIVRYHQGTIKLEIDALDAPNKSDNLYKPGEEYLKESIDLLNQHGVQSVTVIPMIKVLHEICSFWSMKDEGNEAMKHLEQAKIHYKYYKQSFPESTPLSLLGVFGITNHEEPPGEQFLEESHTDTFYYLTQVYGLIEDYITSAVCCYIFMNRQVETKNPDEIYWVLGYWVHKSYQATEEDDFDLSQIRLCLAAASYILEKFEFFFNEISKKVEKNDIEQLVLDPLLESFKIAKAKISSNWASYAFELMSRSQDYLMTKGKDEESKPVSDKTGIPKRPDTTLFQEYLSDPNFETIQNDIERIGSSITDKYLCNFNDAREVFKKLLKWQTESKSFFNPSQHLVDFINININISDAFQILAFFEKDKSRQAKMQKRRIDILEETIKDLNLEDHEDECRQLWMELGKVYSDLLKIKLEVLETTKDKTPAPNELIAKINRLTKSAILHFQKFIDSLNNLKEYSDHLLEGNLYAHCQIGKLYNNFITDDKQKQLKNLRQGLLASNYVIECCEKNSKADSLVSEDVFETCKKLTKTLREKMNKLIEEMSAS